MGSGTSGLAGRGGSPGRSPSSPRTRSGQATPATGFLRRPARSTRFHSELIRAAWSRRSARIDETLRINEDYEFNTRIRQKGGVVWLDPAIRSVYFARSSLSGLARQYWRYGFWKLRMLKRYPGSLRWRQAVPALFVVSLLGLGLGSILPVVGPAARLALAGELILYISVLILAGLQAAMRKQDLLLAAGVPFGIAALHISWGSGFLWSLLQSLFQSKVTKDHEIHDLR